MFKPSDARHLTLPVEDHPLVIAYHPCLDLAACVETDGRPFLYYNGHACYTDPDDHHPAQVVVRAAYLPQTQALNWLADIMGRCRTHDRPLGQLQNRTVLRRDRQVNVVTMKPAKWMHP